MQRCTVLYYPIPDAKLSCWLSENLLCSKIARAPGKKNYVGKFASFPLGVVFADKSGLPSILTPDSANKKPAVAAWKHWNFGNFGREKKGPGDQRQRLSQENAEDHSICEAGLPFFLKKFPFDFLQKNPPPCFAWCTFSVCLKLQNQKISRKGTWECQI